MPLGGVSFRLREGFRLSGSQREPCLSSFSRNAPTQKTHRSIVSTASSQTRATPDGLAALREFQR
jgi:hypothetical protein